LIKLQKETLDGTGVPCVIDIVAKNPEALVRYVNPASEVTDVPDKRP